MNTELIDWTHTQANTNNEQQTESTINFYQDLHSIFSLCANVKTSYIYINTQHIQYYNEMETFSQITDIQLTFILYMHALRSISKKYRIHLHLSCARFFDL